MGKLTVITGPMFSGKTTRLIETLQGQDVPDRLYVHYLSAHLRDDKLCARGGIPHPAIPAGDNLPHQISNLGHVGVVGIDEVQFFSEYAMTYVVLTLKGMGVDVIASGLNMDFRGFPYGYGKRRSGPVGTLMAMADHIELLTAVCAVCGGEATRTQRLVDGDPVAHDAPLTVVGDTESYEARCHECHVVRGSDDDA